LLIDTGGLVLDAGEPLTEKINFQVDIAIGQADLLLFIVDIKDGPVPADYEIASKLRKTRKPVLVVANKSDSPSRDTDAYGFFELGIGEAIAVSAKNRRNISGLIEKIDSMLPGSTEDDNDEANTNPALCIVGKPNVGKSTLVNKIVGEQRVIVDDSPGTTRNPAKCLHKINNEDWILVDMAGMWRKKRGKHIEEIISMIAARKEIERSDAVILMLDLSEPLTFQDSRLAGWIVEAAKPCIVAGNKLDLIDVSKLSEEEYRASLIKTMPFMKFAPLILISAKNGRGIKKIYSELKKVMKNSRKKIPQEKLDAFIKKVVSKRPPPKAANIRPQIIKLTQAASGLPVFFMLLRHHRLDKIPIHWVNYVKNELYREFEFYGVPVVLKMKKKETVIRGKKR
jgi:GTP-binding protein